MTRFSLNQCSHVSLPEWANHKLEQYFLSQDEWRSFLLTSRITAKVIEFTQVNDMIAVSLDFFWTNGLYPQDEESEWGQIALLVFPTGFHEIYATSDSISQVRFSQSEKSVMVRCKATYADKGRAYMVRYDIANDRCIYR